MPEADEVNVSVRKAGAMEWVKLAIGGGLGVILALSGWKYLTSENKESANFMRTKIEANTVALTEVKSAMQTQAAATTAQTIATQQQTSSQLAATQQQTAAINNLARELKELTEASKEASKTTKTLTSEIKGADQ